jgi:hypothetical protein
MSNQTNNQTNIEYVQEPIINAPAQVKQIIERVWKLEKIRIDRKVKSHINDDILEIVKQVIQ